jgi:hypothetical protein
MQEAQTKFDEKLFFGDRNMDENTDMKIPYVLSLGFRNWSSIYNFGFRG